MNLHAEYDCIIVGAGISGLYCALQLKKKHPQWSIAIAERYKGLGGRTYSYSPPGFEGVQWEMGAGRIHKSHKHIIGLVKTYGLHWIPINSKIGFKKDGSHPVEENPFEEISIPTAIEPLSHLNKEILANHTLEELAIQVYGHEKTKQLFEAFPYRGETTTLRADLALKAFLNGGEMNTHEGYGFLQEGFSELVARIVKKLESLGVVILPRHRLQNLIARDEGATDCIFEYGYSEKGKPHGSITLRAKRCVVLALHRDALAELKPFQDWTVLKYLKTQPLLRTYAIFKESWFSDLPRIVTPMRPRYILPMNPEKGTLMISYTDGDNTSFYRKIQSKHGDKALEKIILQDIRSLFPDRTIPNPLFFKSHPWETGCTYWLPGSYDPESCSKESVHPLPKHLPNVFLCGESWSLRQAWVEGALEHTEMCLNAIH